MDKKEDREITMGFKIEGNIPCPTQQSKYPFKEMKVGDSFLVPKHFEMRVRTASQYFSKRNAPYKFSVAKTVDGARIWRIA